MSTISRSTANATAQVMNSVSISMLKKAMYADTSGALKLLDQLPATSAAPAPMAPGQRLDMRV